MKNTFRFCEKNSKTKEILLNSIVIFTIIGIGTNFGSFYKEIDALNV